MWCRELLRLGIEVALIPVEAGVTVIAIAVLILAGEGWAEAT